MATLGDRIGPPETQSIVLRMQWDQWIAIRDMGREHHRTTSSEIRAAIDYWLGMHEAEKEYTERAGRVAHEDQR